MESPGEALRGDSGRRAHLCHRGGIVTGFIQASLYVFAGCAALGLLPAAVLAAKAGILRMFILALLIVAVVMWVLCTAAGGYR